jgi:hypothetical protein
MSRTTYTALTGLVTLQLLAAAALGPTIPAETDIPVTIDENIAVKSDQFGNTFEAHVTRNVVVDGSVVIPAGADANVMLVKSEETPGAATFRLAQVSVGGGLRRVTTDVARADATKSGLSTGKKTGIGAVAGAVLGVVTGGGLLKGAVVGAGGGLAWGLLDHGSPRVDRNTQLLFSLRHPIRVT